MINYNVIYFMIDYKVLKYDTGLLHVQVSINRILSIKIKKNSIYELLIQEVLIFIYLII